jgi:hypothetical protein
MVDFMWIQRIYKSGRQLKWSQDIHHYQYNVNYCHFVKTSQVYYVIIITIDESFLHCVSSNIPYIISMTINN